MGVGQKFKNGLKEIRRILLYGSRASTKRYIRYMNRMGAQIDESVQMAVPESVRLDKTTPWMLRIGKNVYIAEGVKILTHDASWMVMMGKTESCMGI